uniref:Uncharacterized protein n=1 Tax=Dictyoglomus turgidum TaxID=513050 RepID=A0A7C3SMB1_9BACT
MISDKKIKEKLLKEFMGLYSDWKLTDDYKMKRIEDEIKKEMVKSLISYAFDEGFKKGRENQD